MGENDMSRKSFLIWGFVIIHLNVTAYAIMMYLALSKNIDPETTGGMINDGIFLMHLVGFGAILYMRFKTIGRRKRVLALCLPFFILSGILGSFLMLGFVTLDIFGAHDRYFNVITEWSKTGDPALPVSWTVSQRLDYILLTWVPAFYLTYWGLFALLWFGSLDPRTPGKGRFGKFVKRISGRDEVLGSAAVVSA